MPAHPATARVDVVRLWQLPDDFFARPLDEQWAAVKAVTAPAPELAAPRRACVLSFTDDALATGFFLATLALPFGLALSFLYFLRAGRAKSALRDAREWSDAAKMGQNGSRLALQN